MSDNIKITKKLKFDYPDLMRQVDLSYEFTLRDVVRAVHNSKIPMPVLSQLLRCNYLEEYWEEINSKKFKDDSDIEYLEIFWWGTTSNWDKKPDSHHSLCLHGVGKKGYIPDDLKKMCKPEEIKKMKKGGWTQNYAVEFSPLYKLANYSIKVCGELSITHYENMHGDHNRTDVFEKIKFKPSITLMDLLYAIFWELSFMGSPKRRNAKAEELNERSSELHKALEAGELGECFSSEEVQKKIKNTIKKVTKAKKAKEAKKAKSTKSTKSTKKSQKRRKKDGMRRVCKKTKKI